MISPLGTFDDAGRISGLLIHVARRLSWMKIFRRFTHFDILVLSLHYDLYLEQLILPPLVCKLAKNDPIFLKRGFFVIP